MTPTFPAINRAAPKVSIIVVSFNTREMTLACLRSIYEQTPAQLFELIVIDNASTDGSAEAIAREFPQTRLFALQENLGFAAANNFAAKQAAGEWLLLLNPDTVVLDGAIARLLAFAEHSAQARPSAGIFGGRTLYADGKLNPTSCWAKPTLWSTFCYGVGLTGLLRSSRLFNPEAMPDWRRDSVRAVDIVTGCFLLLRRELWQTLNGFDPAFFMYGEEADLCLRAARAGVTALICPDATIIHYDGASERVRSGRIVRLFRARAQLLRKLYGWRGAVLSPRLLDLWAFSRMAGAKLAALLRGRASEVGTTWGEVWQQRAQWHKTG